METFTITAPQTTMVIIEVPAFPPEKPEPPKAIQAQVQEGVYHCIHDSTLGVGTSVIYLTNCDDAEAWKRYATYYLGKGENLAVVRESFWKWSRVPVGQRSGGTMSWTSGPSFSGGPV